MASVRLGHSRDFVEQCAFGLIGGGIIRSIWLGAPLRVGGRVRGVPVRDRLADNETVEKRGNGWWPYQTRIVNRRVKGAPVRFAIRGIAIQWCGRQLATDSIILRFAEQRVLPTSNHSLLTSTPSLDSFRNSRCSGASIQRRSGDPWSEGAVHSWSCCSAFCENTVRDVARDFALAINGGGNDLRPRRHRVVLITRFLQLLPRHARPRGDDCTNGFGSGPKC